MKIPKFLDYLIALLIQHLAALISKVVIFPAGDLNEADVFLRLGVVFLCVGSFYLFNKNLVYPTVLSAIILTALIKII